MMMLKTHNKVFGAILDFLDETRYKFVFSNFEGGWLGLENQILCNKVQVSIFDLIQLCSSFSLYLDKIV